MTKMIRIKEEVFNKAIDKYPDETWSKRVSRLYMVENKPEITDPLGTKAYLQYASEKDLIALKSKINQFYEEINEMKDKIEGICKINRLIMPNSQ